MSKVAAVVLAGGRGTRMGNLCFDRPKPALPFAGGFRVIDFSLTNCVHSEVKDITVLIDYQRASMANYLTRWYAANHHLKTFKVMQPRCGSYKGTGDAVYQNLDHIDELDADLVLVLAGDHVYKMDYRKLVAFHKQSHADVTIGVVPVPPQEVHRFGILSTDSEGRITDFIEKPKTANSNLASMGIYLFNRKLLSQSLSDDAADPASAHDFGHSIIPRLVAGHRLFAYPFNGYWRDIGTIEAYFETNMELLHSRPAFTLDGAWPVLTMSDEYSLDKKNAGEVVNSLVCPGAIIKGRVASSVIGPGVWVEEQAVVKNSVIMANSYIGYHSVIESSIIDEGVNIAKMCYLGFGTAVSESGITVLGKGVNVPPYTAIGRGCHISPHSGPAEFITNSLPRCYHFPSPVATLEKALVEGEPQ